MRMTRKIAMQQTMRTVTQPTRVRGIHYLLGHTPHHTAPHYTTLRLAYPRPPAPRPDCLLWTPPWREWGCQAGIMARCPPYGEPLLTANTDCWHQPASGLSAPWLRPPVTTSPGQPIIFIMRENCSDNSSPEPLSEISYRYPGSMEISQIQTQQISQCQYVLYLYI